MKSPTQLSLYILLMAAMLLSACTSFAAYGSDATAPPSPTTPTTRSYTPQPTQSQDGPTPTEVAWKTYTSDVYSYQVSYPGDWQIAVDTQSNDRNMSENVRFSAASGGLPDIAIYALTGLPPFTGYENCQPDLVFRGLDACQISIPAGQTPASKLIVFHNGDQFFEIALQYEDQDALAVFDRFMASFQFTREVYSGEPVPVQKSYGSKEYRFTVNYPATWSVDLETAADYGSGKNYEHVTFTPDSQASLVNIAIYALTGAAPFSGYENCEQNLEFRGVKACRISIPASQIPATELLVFQKEDAHFEIAMQYFDQAALETFDRFLTSFEFFGDAVQETPSSGGSGSVTGMTRISFADNATGAQVAGDLSTGETKSYVLNVKSDQALLAKVVSPTQNVLLRIYGLSDGQVLLENSMGAGQNSWQGMVPSSQDYVIEVINRDEPTHFTLDVTVPEKIVIPFQPGSISDSMHFTLHAGETHTFIWSIAGGQTVNLKLASNGGKAFLAFSGLQDGQSYLSGEKGAASWTGLVSTTQDYLVQVISQASVDTDCTLDVSINTY
jgi:hypothetical protein